MKISIQHILATTVAFISIISYAAAAFDIQRVIISDQGKEMKLTKSDSTEITLTFAKANTGLYAYLQDQLDTKAIGLSGNPVDAAYTIKINNGVTTVLTITGSAVDIKSTYDAAADKFATNPTVATLTAEPKFTSNQVELEVTLPDKTTASVTLSFNAMNFLKERAYYGTVIVTGLANGSYTFTNGFTNHAFFLEVNGAQSMLLVINKNDHWTLKAIKYAGRPLLFLLMTGFWSGVMTFAVKTLDPSMYALGGGFYGALLGQNTSEDDNQNNPIIIDGEASITEDIGTDPSQSTRPRADRASSSIPDDVTYDSQGSSGTASSDTTEGKEGVFETTDARAATFVVLSATLLALLL